MKTRRRRLRLKMCPCSPDVGDCPRCKPHLRKKSLRRKK